MINNKFEVGVGFRKDFAKSFLKNEDALKPDFFEVAPENWMRMGGYWRKVFKELSERYKFTSHGLSLSIGSPDPLDWNFLQNIKDFLDDFNVSIYSEHLSFSSCNNAHLYDLLPIPFRADAVKHIAGRIREVQDFLERKIAIENISYYTPVAAEMDEATFIRSIVEEADCNMLLDVNNVYVNAFNHKYNAHEFILNLPLERVAYIHMAGHAQVAPDLIIDTHGADIIDPVYELFAWTLERIKPVPVLLERDFNIPGLPHLQSEIDQLKEIIAKSSTDTNKANYAVAS